MSDVVKAGVLEVTVVQAVGVDLLGATSALSRTRRKPALVARVTVDGTTKSGQPAQRSHHPVWFPAQPPSLPRDNTASLSSNSRSRDEHGGSGARNNNSSNSNSNNSSSVSSGGAIETESGADGARGALDRTPARYGGGGGAAETGSNAREVGGGLSDHGDGGRSNSNDSNSGCSSSSSSIARGLLFEVREFYGPTRIVVELVSGGGGSGGGGVGGGGNGGGTVLGACEARLAEALVGRGGGVSGSSSSSMAQRTGNFGLGKAARTAYGPPPITVFTSAGETRQSPPPLPREGPDNNNDNENGDTGDGGGDGDAEAAATHPSLAVAPFHSLAGADTGTDTGTGTGTAPEGERGGDRDRDRDQDQDQPGSPAGDASDTPAAAPQPAPEPAPAAGVLVAPAAAVPTAAATATAAAAAAAAAVAAAAAAATAANVAPAPTQSTGCFPGGGVFGRWRRGARRKRFPGGRDGDSGVAGSTGSGDGSGGGDGGGSSSGSSAHKAGESGGAGTGKKSWAGGRGGGGGTTRFSSARKASSGVAAVRSVAAKVAAAGSTKPGASSSAFTLEEAEGLATSNWGGEAAASGAARDIWKLLVPVGSGGKGGKGKVNGSGAATGSGGGSGPGVAGPAVRLRLRFIPLWDCLADGGGVNGLGALHAAARDGDARLVTSLVHLWQSLSPTTQVLSLPCRRGLTPIQHCIEAGKESALRDLLRGIAKDSLRNGGGGGEEGGDTPLHTAVKAGEEGMLRMLLLQTRRPEAHPTRMFTAIRFGLGNSPNTSVDAVGSDGLTPLALSAICGNASMIKCLLDEGASAASPDARGMTPIAHAAHGGHLLAVRALLKAKAPGGTGSGVPGLGRSKLARLGCAPCKTNQDGMGPVALAAASGSAEVVSELLRSGIPYRTRDGDGRTPLHLAAQSGHVPVLRILVAEMRKDKGKGGRDGGSGSGNAEDVVLPAGDNTWMMDGGPFRLRNLDLFGRTAHATALQHGHPQAAAFLEAAAAELEPLKPKRHHHHHADDGGRRLGSKRRGSAGTSSSCACAVATPGGGGGGAKDGHPPRSSAASPTLRLAQQGSGAESSGGSAQESGASGRPSPVSSISGGLGSAAGSVLESCNSYEYVESDQE